MLAGIGISGLGSVDVFRDLGVLLDRGLTLADQANSICRSSYDILKQIRVIRRTLSSDFAAITVVHSFVLARLDDCYAVCHWLPLLRIRQQQSVLYPVAHLMADKPRLEKISDYIRHDLRYPYDCAV